MILTQQRLNLVDICRPFTLALSTQAGRGDIMFSRFR